MKNILLFFICIFCTFSCADDYLNSEIVEQSSEAFITKAFSYNGKDYYSESYIENDSVIIYIDESVNQLYNEIIEEPELVTEYYENGDVNFYTNLALYEKLKSHNEKYKIRSISVLPKDIHGFMELFGYSPSNNHYLSFQFKEGSFAIPNLDVYNMNLDKGSINILASLPDFTIYMYRHNFYRGPVKILRGLNPDSNYYSRRINLRGMAIPGAVRSMKVVFEGNAKYNPIYQHYCQEFKDHYYDNIQLPIFPAWFNKDKWKPDHLNNISENILKTYTYKPQGKKFYILKNQEVGTVPLYKYDNPFMADTYLATDYRGEYIDGYYYDKILGYIYTTQVGESVPLYRYWSEQNHQWEHIYTTKWLGNYTTDNYKFEFIVGYVFISDDDIYPGM